ncbi:hypothetical protein B0H19DRAFT_1241228 [Mycena capillaripes]|nr:hypothetical protein B0H19DRAFT_1241228 [Mycena capillaripes]
MDGETRIESKAGNPGDDAVGEDSRMINGPTGARSEPTRTKVGQSTEWPTLPQNQKSSKAPEHQTKRPGVRARHPSTHFLPQRISLSCARLQGLKSQVAGALLRSPKFRNLRDHQATAVFNAHILHTPPPESAKPTLFPISRTTVARSGASAKIQHRQKHRLRQTTAATCAHIFQVPPPGAAKPSSHPSSQRNMKSGQPLHRHKR